MAAPSPVVLRFTSAVTSANGITLHQGDASGALVATTAERAPDGKGVILTPTNPLQAHQPYTVVVSNLALISGTLNKTLHFTTRASQEGPKSLVVENSTFKLARHFPDNSTQQPVMDFSTFRLQFTQPIDPSTAHYGLPSSGSTGSSGPGSSGTPNTVALVDQNGDLVPATLLVDGPYLTLDPKPEYLNAGQHYTLTLGTGLASTFGETLAQADDIKFSPQDSTPKGEAPAVLVQHITDSRNGSVLSPLTGAPVNVVAVKGTLLGENGVNATQADAVVHAELADPVTYTNVLPIRIPKGTVLTGSSIDVKIGGAVDAGYDSGKVTMTLLSDATGTMILNPYSTQADAPRIVHLFMDVGITTEDPRANGGFTQNLLHIELVGTSKINTQAGVLDLDAISVVQPDVLGQEYGYAVLSFQLKSYRDQTTAPKAVADTTPPKVQSWTFGTDDATGLDKTAMLQPTDPLIINFDKPLDPQSVPGHVHLIKDEGGTQTELDAKVTVDGAAIVIKPKESLQHPEENGPDIAYTVKLDSGITDISGNIWSDTFDQSFRLATLVQDREVFKYQFGFFLSQGVQDVAEKSPVVLGLYPGFPCALNTATRDLANSLEGRCRGGMQPNTATDDTPGQDDLGDFDPLPADDLLPVAAMPANRPIVVVFSKAIDPGSLFNDAGEAVTFQVHEVDPANPDVPGATVPGSVTLNGDMLRFVPDNPWRKGQYYAYTLYSNGDVTSSSAQCDANQSGAALCGVDGLPVQTQLLSEVSSYGYNKYFPDQPKHLYVYEERAPHADGGGPNLTQYFKGAKETSNVLQMLRLGKNWDSNNNFINDSTPTYKGPSGDLSSEGISWLETPFNEYQNNETDQVDWQPDSSTADLTDPYSGLPLDPDGVKPPPNSAKILSAFYGYNDLSQAEYDSLKTVSDGASAGGNIGCGYTAYPAFEDQTGCDTAGELKYVFPDGLTGTCYAGIPAECPKDKFVYLHGVLFAEVTSDVVTAPSGATSLKVDILPGHILASSFRMYVKSPTGSKTDIVDAGLQVMRMRFPSGKQSIPAYISTGDNIPSLDTSVNLYLDSPGLVRDITDVKDILTVLSHNFYSYPVDDMKLSGPVSFLKDGRMVVEQFNQEDVRFSLENVGQNGPTILQKFILPANGTFLQYVSQPIK